MKFKNSVILILTMVILLSCATNPFTDKKTLAIIPNSQLFPTAFQQYDQFLGLFVGGVNTHGQFLCARWADGFWLDTVSTTGNT